MTSHDEGAASVGQDRRQPSGRPRGRTSVAAGGLVGAGGSAVSTLGGFLLVLAATRLLGASGSGGLFVAVAMSTVLTNVCKLGTDTSLVRFVSQAVTQGHPHVVWKLLRTSVIGSLLASVCVGVGLFVSAGWVSRIVYASDPTLPGPRLLRTVAVFLPFATLTLVLLATTRGFGRVTGFVMVEQVLKPVLRPLLILAIWIGGATVTQATLAWMVPIIPGLLLAGWLVVGLARRSPAADDGHRLDETSVREFWAFAAPRALGGTLEILAPWMGVILLSACSSSSDAGIFTAAARIVTAGTMVLVAMRLALGPHLSAAYARRDLRHVATLHQHSTIWSVLISFPFFLTVAVFPGTVLSLFGVGFSDGAAALVIVIAANLVNVAVGNVQSIVLMAGRSTWNLGNTAAALAVQVAVGLALIPSLGLIGAAIGLGSGVVCNNLLSMRQSSGGLGVAVWSRQLLTALVLTTAVCLPVALLARTVLGPSVGAVALAAAVEVAVLVAVLVRAPRLVDIAGGWRTLTMDLGATSTVS